MFVILGIVLIVTGAVLAFAVEASTDGVDLVVVGYVLIAGGVASILAGAISGAAWHARSRTAMRVERHTSNDGRHVVEDVRTN